MSKARKAAEAVGLTVEQLADMLVDSGITALPVADGITQKYTLEDLGTKLWTDAQREHPTVRAEWFARLAPVQGEALITTLRERGYAAATIAREFGLDPMEVQRTHAKRVDELGSQVVGVRLSTIVGQLHLQMERTMEMELKQGNGRAAWSIAKDYVKALQDLGIVDRAVHRSEVVHKLDDEAKAELDRLAELRSKQARQIEEVRLIEAEVFDQVPDLAAGDPD